jgi:hypothetical protein
MSALAVYALVDRRDAWVVADFVDRWCDRRASDAMLAQQPLTLPVEQRPAGGAWGTTFGWRHAASIAAAVDIGVRGLERSFTVPLLPADERVASAGVTFTADGMLVLGLAVDAARPGAEDDARALLSELARGFGARLGLVAADVPPPADEQAFEAAMARDALALHRSPEGGGAGPPR